MEVLDLFNSGILSCCGPSVLKRGRKASVLAKHMEKNNSNCTWRWAARIVGANPVNRFTNCYKQFSQDGPKCGFGKKKKKKNRPNIGCNYGGCWNQIKSMSLAVHNIVYSWTSTTWQNKGRFWEVIKIAKGFELHYLRANKSSTFCLGS